MKKIAINLFLIYTIQGLSVDLDKKNLCFLLEGKE